MGQNAIFDPEKRDYVAENGSVSTGDDIRAVTYFTLMVPRGKWLYADPGQGSELWKFKNAKRTSDTEQLFFERVKEPIENQIIATGRASAVALKNLEQTRTGTSNQIGVEPVTTRISTQVKLKPVA